MFGRLFAALICAMSLSAIGQTPQADYQRGTITAVTAHQNTPGESSGDVVRYDVSVKVGNTNYVVLFTPPNGSNTVEYSAGTDMLFLVGDNTLTFNSTISGKTEMPILRREALPPRGSLDLSRASGQYFSLKLENLSDKLALSGDQQAKIRPILEQESGELSPLWSNPVISRKEKLETFGKVVRASDEKIKPILSPTQREKLQALRKEQKEQLKKLMAAK